MLDIKEIKITGSNINDFFHDSGYILPTDVLPSFCVKIPFLTSSADISDFYREIARLCIICFISLVDKREENTNSENINTDSRKAEMSKAKAEAVNPNENSREIRAARSAAPSGNTAQRKKAPYILSPYTFSSTYYVTRNDGKMLSLYTDQTIMNRKNIIFYKRTAQTWLTEKNRLATLAEACRLLGIKRKVKNSKDFYVTENGIILFRNRFEEPEGRIRKSQYENLFLERTEIT